MNNIDKLKLGPVVEALNKQLGLDILDGSMVGLTAHIVDVDATGKRGKLRPYHTFALVFSALDEGDDPPFDEEASDLFHKAAVMAVDTALAFVNDMLSNLNGGRVPVGVEAAFLQHMKLAQAD